MTLECKVYQKELRSLGYGLPLYEPNPATYDHVRIGDVGIADRGYFMRIFNCFAQADHNINTRFGVPEDFEPLEAGFQLTRPSQALEPGRWYKSQHVHQIEGGVNFSTKNASAGMKINLSASSQQGAAFCLKHSAERLDAILLIRLQQYMLKHFESWEHFIRSKGFEFELQDMVFVTGHDLTASWATATHVHRRSRGSLAFTVGDFVAAAFASFSRESESTLDVPVRIGPNPYNPPERCYLLESDFPAPGSGVPIKDQCIFLRGYRVAKRRIIPARLRAAAGPANLDMDGDEDMYPDVVPIGFDSGEDNLTDEAIVDHNFAVDLIFSHTNAEVAIINECDVSLLAKCIDDKPTQVALQTREDLRALGLEITSEFDHNLQKKVGTLSALYPVSTALYRTTPKILNHRSSETAAEPPSVSVTENRTIPRLKLSTQKKLSPKMACLFCVNRKIACGPSKSGDLSICNQCERRNLQCVLPSKRVTQMKRKLRQPQTVPDPSPIQRNTPALSTCSTVASSSLSSPSSILDLTQNELEVSSPALSIGDNNPLRLACSHPSFTTRPIPQFVPQSGVDADDIANHLYADHP